LSQPFQSVQEREVGKSIVTKADERSEETLEKAGRMKVSTTLLPEATYSSPWFSVLSHFSHIYYTSP